jgi:hypothetical protein
VQLHRPTAHFSYQRGVHYASIKIFNILPASIVESVKDKKHCISALKRFLIAESLYSNNEYLNCQHEIKIDDCFMRKALQTLYIFSWILCPLVLIPDFLEYMGNDVLALCLVSYPYANRAY